MTKQHSLEQQKLFQRMQQQELKKPIFLWDLHEVVFRKSWKEMLRVILTFAGKRKLVQHVPKGVLRLYKQKTQKKKSISIVDILYFAQTEKNKTLVDFLFQLCCAYRPIPQTVLLIKTLKEKGFVQHIGSNIARPIYQQFKDLYPDIFSLFDYAHVVDVTDYDQVIQKPDPLFFESYLQQCSLNAKEVIFIDNKKKNVQVAEHVGLNGIHFKCPGQLKKILRDFLCNT
jgi:FMN phosphatase YigB (HAD superfamily)